MEASEEAASISVLANLPAKRCFVIRAMVFVIPTMVKLISLTHGD